MLNTASKPLRTQNTLLSGPLIHIALPAMNELEYIGQTLECIKNQPLSNIHTWVCVNQPEAFREDPEKQHICRNNEKTLELIKHYPLDNLHIIDRSSPGQGWLPGKLGVGMARKTLMDAIAQVAHPNDIIVSMDADTVFGEEYLASVKNIFAHNPDALALANPYYHRLGPDETINRAMLRYEIYMRYYALNMRLSGTPYCFSPLGSAMAARISAYRKINGLTPKKSGEDFYFLQKMVKAGKLLMYNTEIVYPGNRLSDRVFFGTGPALIKGLKGNWAAYPLFNPVLFKKVKQTIDLFPDLFHHSHPTPMDDFLKEIFREEDVFAPLRKNNPTLEKFIRACHEKIDGLRILQFLKARHCMQPGSDENNLADFLHEYFETETIVNELKNLDFSTSPLGDIDKIRNFLFETELKLQKDEATKN
ncbi:MAG: glycosyltransferase [Bacteroidota bacterium]